MPDALPTIKAADFFRDGLPCQWFTISQVKRGPRALFGCSFCGGLSKTKTCPAAKLAAPTT